MLTMTYDGVVMDVKLDELGNLEFAKVGGQDISHFFTSATIRDLENEYLAAAKIENEQAQTSEAYWRRFEMAVA